MRKQFIRDLLSIVFFTVFCSGKSLAAVILPLGQSSKQPWIAKYFYAPNNGEKPKENWYAVDFDESEWETLTGPISTNSGLSYYVTAWASNGATYWVRRHFDVKDIEDYLYMYLYVFHDDGSEIYLNGNLIYKDDSFYTNLITITMTEEMRSYFVEGDNVLAMKVSDNYGQAYLDCGIDASNVIPITNSNFDEGTQGWSLSGDGFEYGGQSINYLSRFLTKSPFNITRQIKSPKKGLYKIQVQAFELSDENNPNKSWELYGKENVSSYIYAGDTRHKVKNIFDEAVSTNIYRTNEFYRTYDDTYIPTYMTSVSNAFQNGMYENEFYAYIDTTEFNIGVTQTDQLDKECWVCFDNFRVEYISDKALSKLISDIETISELPMDSTYKSNILSALSKLKETSGYESKSRVIASFSDDIVNSMISAEQYIQIKQAKDDLQCRLDTGELMSEIAILEAKELINNVATQLTEGKITASETQKILTQFNNLNKRLNYTYLDIVVTVPGSLGDSILSKVENFVDVQSIKISGTLNEADISNIQTRLSQLREIDMTDVKMISLPNRFFYQRSLLEIVKLPSQLTTIGEYAFYQCYGIRNIDFPTTLTTINRYGFSECDNIQEVILPEGFKSMGQGAFYSCDNNKHIKLPSTLVSISSDAFSYNLNLRNIEFSEGLTHIYDYAFHECVALNNLQFPTSLDYIGVYAFSYNRSLSNIEFNEGLYQIADNAFYNCDALTEVILPSSLVLANQSPFDYCDNLMKVTSLSIEPPYMTDQIPYGLNMNGRELYVPALTINTYKQTTGWDKFQIIKPIDYLPENFTIHGNLKLTLPETISTNYKPDVTFIHDQKGTSYLQYSSLIVNGEGTLSMSNFNICWDPNYQYEQYNRNQNYCSLINNSHLRADNVSITIYTHNDRWTFLTLPFDVKVSDIKTTLDGTTNWIIRKYNSEKRALGEMSDTWEKMTDDDILKAGEGYIIQSSRYVNTEWQSFSGFIMKAINNVNKNSIFMNTDITLHLNEYRSEFAHNRSWNFIGNPYPCYYDIRFMDLESPITIWNMRNNTYEAYSPMDDSYILCPGEAFFVQRPISTSSIVFNKDGRQINRDIRNIETATRANVHRTHSSNTSRTIVNLSLSDRNNVDRTRIVINDNASMQYEMDKDASKFMSDDLSVPQIFTSYAGVNYAINERPMGNGMIELSLRITKDGEYTISMNRDNVLPFDVYLIDTKIDRKVLLSELGDYTFEAVADEDENRFMIMLSNESISTGVEQVNDMSDSPIYNLQGIKVDKITLPGIYIQNGKKIIVE